MGDSYPLSEAQRGLIEAFRVDEPLVGTALEEIWESGHYAVGSDVDFSVRRVPVAFQFLVDRMHGMDVLDLVGDQIDHEAAMSALQEAVDKTESGYGWLFEPARQLLARQGSITIVGLQVNRNDDSSLFVDVFYPRVFRELVFNVRDQLLTDPELKKRVEAEHGEEYVRSIVQANPEKPDDLAHTVAIDMLRTCLIIGRERNQDPGQS